MQRDRCRTRDMVRVLKEVFDEQERCERYIRYFDETIARVDKVISSIPDDQRLKVLYCNYKTMTAHQRWWIEKAGDISVSKNDLAASLMFDLEQLLTWNPDMIFVTGNEVGMVYNESRISGESAVKNKKVFARLGVIRESSR